MSHSYRRPSRLAPDAHERGLLPVLKSVRDMPPVRQVEEPKPPLLLEASELAESRQVLREVEVVRHDEVVGDEVCPFVFMAFPDVDWGFGILARGHDFRMVGIPLAFFLDARHIVAERDRQRNWRRLREREIVHRDVDWDLSWRNAVRRDGYRADVFPGRLAFGACHANPEALDLAVRHIGVVEESEEGVGPPTRFGPGALFPFLDDDGVRRGLACFHVTDDAAGDGRSRQLVARANPQSPLRHKRRDGDTHVLKRVSPFRRNGDLNAFMLVARKAEANPVRDGRERAKVRPAAWTNSFHRRGLRHAQNAFARFRCRGWSDCRQQDGNGRKASCPANGRTASVS